MGSASLFFLLPFREGRRVAPGWVLGILLVLGSLPAVAAPDLPNFHAVAPGILAR